MCCCTVVEGTEINFVDWCCCCFSKTRVKTSKANFIYYEALHFSPPAPTPPAPTPRPCPWCQTGFLSPLMQDGQRHRGRGRGRGRGGEAEAEVERQRQRLRGRGRGRGRGGDFSEAFPCPLFNRPPPPPPQWLATSHLLKVGSTQRGWGGYEGKKRVCVPKVGLSLLALYSTFHFSREENSSWVVWWVDPKRDHPPPPSRRRSRGQGQTTGRGKATPALF